MLVIEWSKNGEYDLNAMLVMEWSKNGEYDLDATSLRLDLQWFYLHIPNFLYTLLLTWLTVSDVRCRYSLGANPWGVKDSLIL